MRNPPREFFKRLPTVSVGGFTILAVIAGALGGVIALLSPISLDRLVALVASVGGLGAAVATFQTVQEMRAARVFSSRARITAKILDDPLKFRWVLSKANSVVGPKSPRISIKNASLGVAQDIHVQWKIKNPLTRAEFNSAKSLVTSPYSIDIDSSGFVLEFSRGLITDTRLIVNGDERQFSGDLGPGQDGLLEVPQSTINYAFIKWISYMEMAGRVGRVEIENIPTFILRFTHSSPYEKSLNDDHILKFHLAGFRFFGPRGRVLSGMWPSGWRAVEIEMRMEFASGEIDARPVVIA